MFKKAKMSLYIIAIVSVVAIFAIVLLSQNGLPSFDGDLTGDAKRALMQKNVQPSQASELPSLNRRGLTIERVPQRSAPTVARAPIRYGDQGSQQEIWEEEGGNSEELVQDCLENGYYNPATYSWDYTPTLAECQEWAQSQVYGSGSESCAINCQFASGSCLSGCAEQLSNCLANCND